MAMIVQTLTVLDSDGEQSLDEAIAQRFEAEDTGEQTVSISAEDAFIGTT